LNKIDSGAQISPDGRYRYNLWRVWDASQPIVVFVALNPSTADEEKNDPTVKRLIGFTKAWGYGGFHLINLFAYRATDPARLAAAADPVGPDNDKVIALYRKFRIVACWGVHGALFDRDKAVLSILREADLQSFGLTKDGHPKHPLYLANESELVVFRAGADTLSRTERLAVIRRDWDGGIMAADDARWLLNEVSGLQAQNEQQVGHIKVLEAHVRSLEERPVGKTALEAAAENLIRDPKQMNPLDTFKS